MAFQSFLFIFGFLPAVLAGYHLSRARPALQRWWLAACSWVFYAYAGWGAVPVLAASILLNFWISTRLGPEAPGGGRWLRLGLSLNILLLLVFKYAGFAAANFNALAGTRFPAPHLVLPLGVSFFSIQQVIFLVDRHQGVTERQRFADYVLFVCWFPYILAGPITRWKEVMPQMHAAGRRGLDAEAISRGLTLFVLGLAKKVLIADSFEKTVASVYSRPAEAGFLGAWIGVIAFALQLYYDFSGYTDMARGIAQGLNITLPENFRDPFRALSIIEFWQRWHITLTNFITNYIYSPMIRAWGRPTFRKAMWATFLAMTIAGLWHGASWCFVVFGVWHGLGFVVNHLWRKSKRRLPEGICWAVNTAFVLIGFVFFRSATLADAMRLLGVMLRPAGLTVAGLRSALAVATVAEWAAFVIAIGLVCAPVRAAGAAESGSLRPRFAAALAVVFFLTLVVMNSKATVTFIYRQF
jgi:D-alanyl-lipoteichoic acid acyltransferase DltB (MBOAT superfamily)